MKTAKGKENVNKKAFSTRTTTGGGDSRNENAASWKIAAENALCVCAGSSAAVWRTSDGWSKDGCNSDSSESIHIFPKS